MKLERIAVVLLTGGVFAAGFWGCGGDDGDGTSTTGTGGSGGTPTTTSTMAQGVGGGAGGTMVDENIGKACASDADCGMGNTCVTPAANDMFFGGGVAGGYCTRACTADADCGGQKCLDGMCLESCTFGDPPLQQGSMPDPNKCHARSDVACAPFNVMGQRIDVCYPNCGADSQCPMGRVCDPRINVCVDAANVTPGAPDGDACMQGGMETCAGHCINFSSFLQCARYCVLVGDPALQCGGPNQGACLWPLGVDAQTGSSFGDVAACAEACTQHSDCQTPFLYCDAFQITQGFNDNGFCLTPDACGAGDTCAMGYTCVTTPMNTKVCVSDAYPMGGTGGGGGMGGAGGAGGAGGM